MVSGEGAILAMPEIGIEIPLAELYDRVAAQPDDTESEMAPAR